MPVVSDPVLSDQVEALARAIAGPAAGAALLELARRIAEAEIDLRRVREARHQLLNRAWRDPGYESDARRREQQALVAALFRLGGPVTPMPDDCISGIEAGGTAQAGHDPGGRGLSVARHRAV